MSEPQFSYTSAEKRNELSYLFLGTIVLGITTIARRFIQKGEKNLQATELKTLRTLATAAEGYEDKFQSLPVPESLPDIVRYKLLQLHINQGFAARLPGVSDAKFHSSWTVNKNQIFTLSRPCMIN